MSVYRIMLKDHNVMYALAEPVPYITCIFMYIVNKTSVILPKFCQIWKPTTTTGSEGDRRTS